MPRFAESVDVSTTVEQSFDYVTDQSKVPEWNEHVQRVEVVGGVPVSVGAVLVQHRRRGTKDFDLTFEVVEHERPRRHSVTGSVFGVVTTMSFDFAEVPSGTRITMTADVSGKGLRALLAAPVAREMHKSVVSGLEDLERRLAPPH